MIEQGGEVWTPAMIGEAIRKAFRMMPSTGIWTRSGNRHVAVGVQGVPSSTFDIVAFSATVLGNGSKERIAVMAWGRLTANNGEDVASINEWCAVAGWDKTTFWRRKNRACVKIANAKNAVDRVKSSPDRIFHLDSATERARPSECADEQIGA